MKEFVRAYWFWLLWPVIVGIVLVVVALMSDDSSAFTYDV